MTMNNRTDRLSNSSNLKKTISALAGAGLFCTALTGCGSSPTSPNNASPTGTESSATPSAAPRPTETPKPSPSPTAETASPSPEAPEKQKPLELGSVENLDRMEQVSEEMLRMPDEKWDALPVDQKFMYASAMVQQIYITCGPLAGLDSPPFEKHDFKKRIVGDVGENPDAKDAALQSLGFLQIILAATDGQTIPSEDGKTNYYKLHQETFERLRDLFIERHNGFLSKRAEKGVVSKLADSLTSVEVTGFDWIGDKKGDQMNIRLALDWEGGVSPQDLRVGGDTMQIKFFEFIDYGGRKAVYPVFAHKGLPTNLLLKYIALEHPDWQLDRR